MQETSRRGSLPDTGERDFSREPRILVSASSFEGALVSGRFGGSISPCSTERGESDDEDEERKSVGSRGSAARRDGAGAAAPPPFAPPPSAVGAPASAGASVDASVAPSAADSVTSEIPKRGRSKLMLTAPLATSRVCVAPSGTGSIPCCNAAICAADGVAGLPCAVHSVYASPWVSSTRRWVTDTRAPKLLGTLTFS